jgi:hypothetical protein
MWHENGMCESDYYESTEYRTAVDGSSEIQDFYARHDKESIDKFT